MAWHELPLIIFTVLAQTSVGAFLVLGTLLLTKRIPVNIEQRLHKAMFVLWGLMGLGFVASVLHLGSPQRAMNALNMVGNSWLSNEIATGSLFFALGGKVVWSVGFCMALGQFIGARFGSKLVLKKGVKLIKPLLVTVSLVMSAKLVWSQYPELFSWLV